MTGTNAIPLSNGAHFGNAAVFFFARASALTVASSSDGSTAGVGDVMCGVMCGVIIGGIDRDNPKRGVD
jgi:hypothetical protein